MRARLVLEVKEEHGKFYASPQLVKRIIDETFKIVDINTVSEIIEPATGGGAFITQLNSISRKYGIPVTYMDLHIDKAVAHIIKKPQDFLTYVPEGKYFDPNRLIITGPPYGEARNDPKLARKFGTKAAEIAGHFSFIAPVSWLIDNYPALGVKIINGIHLGDLEFSSVGNKKHNVRTAIVICESISPEQWKMEKKKDEDFTRLDRDFKIQNWNPKVHSSQGWDYFINYWGQKYSGEVSRKPVSKTGIPFSWALSIKLENQNPILAQKYHAWMKTFEQNYKEKIAQYSLDSDNKVPLKLFKRFLRDAMYKK